MCQRIAIVFLVGIVLWACSVSFGVEPVRVERAYRAADGTFDAPYRWQDLRVPITSTKIDTTNPPDFDNYKGMAVGTYQFPGNSTATVYFTAQLPHGIDRSAPLEAHVHYAPDADIGAATITFRLDYLIIGTNGVAAAATSYVQNSATGVSSNTHSLLDLGSIALPSSGVDSAMLICRFSRPGNDSSTAVVHVFDVDFHYKVRAVGSVGEYGD